MCTSILLGMHGCKFSVKCIEVELFGQNKKSNFRCLLWVSRFQRGSREPESCPWGRRYALTVLSRVACRYVALSQQLVAVTLPFVVVVVVDLVHVLDLVHIFCSSYTQNFGVNSVWGINLIALNSLG